MNSRAFSCGDSSVVMQPVGNGRAMADLSSVAAPEPAELPALPVPPPTKPKKKPAAKKRPPPRPDPGQGKLF